MGTLNISHLTPGMTLENTLVINASTVLKAGVVLTAEHIKALKSWGINEAEIVGFSEETYQSDAISSFDVNQIEVLKENLKKRFGQNNLDHPFLAELYAICLNIEFEKGGLSDEH